MEWTGSKILTAMLVLLIYKTAFFCPCCAESRDPNAKQNILTQRDIAFGRSQVTAMLIDRPGMASFAADDNPMSSWAARQFAGEITGHRYYWKNHPHYNSPKRLLACHSFPLAEQTGWITVEDVDDGGYIVDGERMWANAIYELFNTHNDQAYKLLTLEALSGKLSKQQYVERTTKLEYKVVGKVASFYRDFVLPLAPKLSTPTHERYWFADYPATYEEWRTQSKQKQPVDSLFFDYFYEHEIAPRIRH